MGRRLFAIAAVLAAVFCVAAVAATVAARVRPRNLPQSWSDWPVGWTLTADGPCRVRRDPWPLADVAPMTHKTASRASGRHLQTADYVLVQRWERRDTIHVGPPAGAPAGAPDRVVLIRTWVVCLPFVPWICVTASVPLAWAAAEVRRRVAAKRMTSVGLCAACGYDLRATPDRCPECGAVPAQSNRVPQNTPAGR